MNIRTDFWDKKEFSNPPLKDSQIKKAELQLGVSLPRTLIELLQIQNGGYTKGFVYPINFRTSWANDHVPFEELFGINFTDIGSQPVSLTHSVSLTKDWGLPSNQVVLSGDGHWYITLDYRTNSKNPQVAWINIEIGEDIKLSDSFDEFLDKLVSDEDFNFE